jgi:hypothetical protein
MATHRSSNPISRPDKRRLAGVASLILSYSKAKQPAESPELADLIEQERDRVSNTQLFRLCAIASLR